MTDKKKQLLMLEDLGIPKTTFENLVRKDDLPYKIVWKESEADPQNVAVLVNVKKSVNREVLQKYPNLKAVAVAFTGYDSVDLGYCREKGIAVYNVPGYATDSVTELVVGLSIALLRQIPKAHNLTGSGQWDLAPGFELAGKTVGILGTGQIGLNTARVFSALNCKLIGWSRTEKEVFKELGGRYMSDKQDVFAEADIISIHLPHNNTTEGLIAKKELSAMKKSAYVINTARGPIIEEKALINALQTDLIAGAGLDVFAHEPLPEKHPFRSMTNVILTPHIAFKTEEALLRRANITVNNIADHLRGKKDNRVD